MSRANAISINELARAFGVSTMTLYLWRQGTPTKDPLPHLAEPVGNSNRITFKRGEVKTWAKKHGLELDFDRKEPTKSAPGPVKKIPKRDSRKVKH